MKAERRTTNAGATITPANSSKKSPLRQPLFLLVAGLLFILLSWTYSNHFENPFHFDDAHTIVNNTAIRKLDSIPAFFKDARTFSTLPANQAWRPGTTTLNAIDYAVQEHMNEAVKKDSLGTAAKFQKTFCPEWMKSGETGINPFWFHFSIYGTYLFLGVLLFFMLLYIFRKAFPLENYMHWPALLGTFLFMLHTANAETINYIISRDDSFSTMTVVLAFVLYFYSAGARKFHLYLLPVLLGFFVKEPTVIFAPLLLVFFWLFGEPDKNKTAFAWQVSLAFLLAAVLYVVSRAMTPPHRTLGGGEWYWYLATQAFVIVHYFNTFFFPFHLSADTDWKPVNSFFDDRVLMGTAFIAVLCWLAWRCSKRQETKPITFGIAWFFFALAPTSTIFAFSEVLNDHRTFFPYIGLVIAFTCAGILFFQKAKALGEIKIAKPLLLLFSFALLIAHAAGTHHRNKVWHTEKDLWKDVTEKSPGNGRGWMNYGLAIMGENTTGRDTTYQRLHMDSVIFCFSKALELYPNYSYANINMAIAQAKKGHVREAEQYYQKALLADPYNPECYYFYGLYLLQNQRLQEAVVILNKGKAISPQHEGINLSLNYLQTLKTPLQSAQEIAKQNPTADNYVNLSLAFYNEGLFLESAVAAKEAVRLQPNDVKAWNNICAAYNKIGEWDSACAAGKKALELSPDDQLCKNNFAIASTAKAHFDKLEADAKKQPDYNKWINLSLEWYKSGNYKKSMIAAEEATLLNPNDVVGWNNVCAAANKTGDWDRAIVAGERAVKINPNFEQAVNNLAEAKRGKEGK